ncbi:MAG: ectoine/hydroxyectoine ABC transporter substrate-binding protein EhuB [Rhodobacteraceae bacterium]|nr:ectoine/hydroxyectoine ABC transporter substrate-binding protein EhuB [Paracoccaceae bacterium]
MFESNLLRRHALALAGFMVAVGLSGAALSQDLMSKAMDKGINVAFYNFKPYTYMDENNNLVGTDIELLKVVLEGIGGNIDNAQAVDWGALIPGVQAGRFDVVAAGMFVNPDRCAQVRFSQPYFGIKQALVVLKGNPHGLSNFESVRDKGVKIGVISGAAQHKFSTRAGVSEDNILQLPDNPAGIAALRAGRIDAWAVSAPGVRDIVAGVPEGDLEAGPAFAEVAGEPAVSHGAFAFRKEDAAFVDEFDKHLTAVVGTPEHIAIMEKYGMTQDELPVAGTTTEMLCAGG